MDKVEYLRQWRKSHPEYQHEWHKSHPGYQREWHKNHPEYSRKYYRKNRIRILEHCRKYFQAHKEQALLKHKEYRRRHVIGTGNPPRVIYGLNKKAYPPDNLCPYCKRQARLLYHHWDDMDYNDGIWLCVGCHNKVHKLVQSTEPDRTAIIRNLY